MYLHDSSFIHTFMQISVGVAPAATLYEQSNNCKVDATPDEAEDSSKVGQAGLFQFYVICVAVAYFYAD